jgi:hypothetical protein
VGKAFIDGVAECLSVVDARFDVCGTEPLRARRTGDSGSSLPRTPGHQSRGSRPDSTTSAASRLSCRSLPAGTACRKRAPRPRPRRRAAYGAPGAPVGPANYKIASRWYAMAGRFAQEAASTVTDEDPQVSEDR